MSGLSRAASAAVLVALAWGPAAQAHRAWMVPSSTVLSGSDPWVTVDAAISNSLFHPDHNPMRLDGVTATGPDGKAWKLENGSTGRFRSTFDLHLTASGTYRISNVGDTMAASYKVGDEVKRWRGTAQELTTAIPKEATEVKVSRNLRRMETFVTAGAPTLAAFKPTGVGLELEPVTHPNDLAASEKARFRLLLDGKPAGDVEVEVARGGARYRNNPGDFTVKSGSDGVFEIAWPGPGMYWIEASVRGQDPSGVTRNSGYAATFEVLPD